jgi:protein phosphatase inhibitor 2
MAEQTSPTLHRSPSSQARPTKGILKNAPRQDSADNVPTQCVHIESHLCPTEQHRSILWDENNLAYNEGQKDSTMKITEPKTPYVRYNPLTDEVEGGQPSSAASLIGQRLIDIARYSQLLSRYSIVQ